MSAERFKLMIDLGTYPELVSIQEIAMALRGVARSVERKEFGEQGWPSGQIFDHLGRYIGEWEIAPKE